MIRIFLGLLILVLAGLVALGVLAVRPGALDAPVAPAATASAAAASAAARVQLYHYWDGSFARLRDSLARQAEQWNAANGDCRLLATPVAHEALKLNARAMLGNAVGAEMLSWWAGGRTRELAAADLLAPLDPWWVRAGMTGRFPPGVVAQACFYPDPAGGASRPYLVPLVQSYTGCFYNRAVFAEAGLAPPGTWEGLLATCRTLRARGINPIALGTRARWPAQFWFDYLLLRTAGPDYRDRLVTGRARWTDPEVLAAFARWSELLAIKAFNPAPESGDWLDSVRLVQSRGAAMVLMGSWAIDPWTAQGWVGGTDYDWFPFPAITPGVEDTCLTGIDGVVLAAGGQDRAAAERILDHLASAPVQRALAEALGGFSPHLGVGDDAYDDLRRRIRASVPARVAFPLDLAATTPVSELGLDLFVRFLAEPARIRDLLAEMDAAIARLPAPPAR